MKLDIKNEDQAWLKYRKNFSDIYDKSNYNNSLQSITMRASHRLLERSYGEEEFFPSVLEIGAGTGQHLDCVRHKFDDYILTDLDEETLAVAKKRHQGRHGGRIHFEVQAAGGLEYPDNSFDRLIATHVLEHIYQPHLAIKEWARVIKNGGTLSILIPTDPGFAWRLGRRLGPRRNAVANGIAYDYVMAREHVNSCSNLIAILRHYFEKPTELWWPFPLASVDINLFYAFHAVIKK